MLKTKFLFFLKILPTNMKETLNSPSDSVLKIFENFDNGMTSVTDFHFFLHCNICNLINSKSKVSEIFIIDRHHIDLLSIEISLIFV